jgi:hypothetical protein
MTIFDDDFGVFPGAFVFKGLADFSVTGAKPRALD